MEWLNYHHLLYFWMVAKEGGVGRAAAKLRLAHPTVSSQVHTLEETLGEKLLARSGRQVVLTEVGKTVFSYADEIFSLGRELQDAVKGRPTGRPLRLRVGITSAVPKLVVSKLLEPAHHLPYPVQMVCREDEPDRLVADLSTHSLDVIISDQPLSPGARVRAFDHLLGDCGVAFLAAPRLASAHRRGFPRSLDGAPVLLPIVGAALRRALDGWFDGHGIRPRIVAEVDDSALLKTFGQDGKGIFAVPVVIEPAVRRQYACRLVGYAEGVRERFYAISAERRLRHPAVIAISQAAREELFR
jgi:LysR family transcriptional activator of nhaA